MKIPNLWRAVLAPSRGVVLSMATGCGLTSFVVPEEPVDEPARIDVDTLAPLDAAVACIDLEPGEWLGAVSPEGQAWLVTDQAAGPRLRVVDPFDRDREAELQLEMPPVQQMRAWSDTTATFVAGGTVWRLEDGETRVRLTEPPATVAAGMPWCGELAIDGVIVSGREWIEQRGDDWWVWSQTGDAPLVQILDRSGQCAGADGISLAMSGDGRLWRVAEDRAESLERIEGLVDAAATEEGTAVLLADGVVWTGEPGDWTETRLDAAEPLDRLTASGTALYVAGGPVVVQLREGRLSRLQTAPGTIVTDLGAHEGGVWVVDQTQACHHAEGPMLRVDGIRPYQLTLDDTFAFEASVVVPGVGVQPGWSMVVTANGQPVDGPDPAPAEVVGQYPEAATTTFDIEATRDGERLTRSVVVSRLRLPGERSWKLDVAPLFADHCEQCHGVDGIATDFTTYEAWVEHIANIEVRVLDIRDMPPSDPSFGEIERGVIADWIDGGLQP